jgi:hypothetical protein
VENHLFSLCDLLNQRSGTIYITFVDDYPLIIPENLIKIQSAASEDMLFKANVDDGRTTDIRPS